MELLNWVVDEEGGGRGRLAGGGALVLNNISTTGHCIPLEPDEMDHGVDFEWDADPTVRDVY